MQDTWIVVADGSKAKIYGYIGPKSPLVRVDEGELTHTRELSQDIVDTGRGRRQDYGQGQGSAMNRSADPHAHEQRIFMKELADYLYERKDKVDRIIIAAAPKMLGELRQDLHKDVAAKVSDELDKDLTNIPENELPKHLQSVLNIEEHPTERDEMKGYYYGRAGGL